METNTSNPVVCIIGKTKSLIEANTLHPVVCIMGKRKQNPKSLENLKLGSQSRYQGKIRVTATLLPNTKNWLEKSGNLSKGIDEIVNRIMSGELVDHRLLLEAEERIRELENQLDHWIQIAGRDYTKPLTTSTDPTLPPTQPVTRIETLNLKKRAYMAIKRAQINTVEELRTVAVAGKLKEIKDLGDVSIKEINSRLLA